MIINVTDTRNLNKLNSVLPKKDFFLWFYADWCGHCKTMEPEWKKLVKKCGNKYNLARVRDDQKDQLINNLGQNVQGFPTLGSTNNSGGNSGNNSGNSGNNSGNFNTYSGARTSDDFMEYIKQNLAQEKVKRSLKLKRGCNRCTGKQNCQCVRCKAMRASKGRRGMTGRRGRGARRARPSVKKYTFVKPTRGCGGRASRRLIPVKL
jgi:thiol-disulfide isomerase/thioredoxin